MDDQSRLRVDSLNKKLPKDGQTTKITYEWMV